ncbi:hypothetical protein K438DRAFT_1756819 [Mycena galopus ATCC 62051]|nr:hypothetical protein K438DRAFT_1756819 [Mycena galopus ATCC 62051]
METAAKKRPAKKRRLDTPDLDDSRDDSEESGSDEDEEEEDSSSSGSEEEEGLRVQLWMNTITVTRYQLSFFPIAQMMSSVQSAFNLKRGRNINTLDDLLMIPTWPNIPMLGSPISTPSPSPKCQCRQPSPNKEELNNTVLNRSSPAITTTNTLATHEDIEPQAEHLTTLLSGPDYADGQDAQEFPLLRKFAGAILHEEIQRPEIRLCEQDLVDRSVPPVNFT